MSADMNSFTDLKHASEKDHVISFKNESNGCYVSRAKGCALFLLAVAVCVIVGVCVFYLHPDYDRNDDSSRSNERVHGDATTPGAADVTTPSEPESVRLSPHLVPQHYNVHLRPDIYGGDPADFRFTGMLAVFNLLTHWQR